MHVERDIMVCVVECGSFVSYNTVFLFKQKTAYEMRISDWSSDVCSSDPYCRGNARQAIVHRFAVDHQDALVAINDGRQVTLDHDLLQIGRASCRERVCQYV